MYLHRLVNPASVFFNRPTSTYIHTHTHIHTCMRTQYLANTGESRRRRKGGGGRRAGTSLGLTAAPNFARCGPTTGHCSLYCLAKPVDPRPPAAMCFLCDAGRHGIVRARVTCCRPWRRMQQSVTNAKRAEASPEATDSAAHTIHHGERKGLGGGGKVGRLSFALLDQLGSRLGQPS